MEKYAKLMKGLEVCAGPDCCKDGCPYYGETTGSMTCRARLLADAAIAINNEQALHESAEEHIVLLHADAANLEAAHKAVRAERDKLREDNKTLNAEMDDLEAVNNTIRAERDGMRAERDAYANECKALTREVNILHERCHVQQNEINALLLKNSKQDAKTDRPSVGFDGSLAYWCGRADALAEVVSSIVGEASGHE